MFQVKQFRMTEQAIIALVEEVAAQVTKEVESAYQWHS